MRLPFPHRHLLGIDGLTRPEIEILLDMAEEAVEVSRRIDNKRSILSGRTLINLFFEPSTRTEASVELAGKRIGLPPSMQEAPLALAGENDAPHDDALSGQEHH